MCLATSSASIESRFLWGFQDADGKKYPQNTCALRMVADEVLRDIPVKVPSYVELMIELETRSVKSRTAKHWIQSWRRVLMFPKAIILSAISPRRSATKNVNVEDAVQIGEVQLQEFESACPTGFYQTIKMKVITMNEDKKKRGADKWNSVTQD